MIVKLLTEHHLELLSLKGGCRGSFESTILLKISCTGSISNRDCSIAVVRHEVLQFPGQVCQAVSPQNVKHPILKTNKEKIGVFNLNARSYS